MNAKILFAMSAATIALTGATFSISESRNAGAPFVSPLTLVNSLCGDDAAANAKRRQFFVRTAQAYASVRKESESGEMLAQDEKIGDIKYAVTTANEEAQAHFNHALAHTWNFNHGAAIEHFKAAQAADPECAMCYWGEAFAYGPNINAPMGDDAYAPAWAAIQRAVSLKDGASEKERALIDALAKRYVADPLKDRSGLDAAFADAVGAVADQYQDDDFIQALAAEANMDTQAWDYWEADGRTPKGRTGATLARLEKVLARNPQHPAAIHLYIHTTEATLDPHRAAPYAERLAALAPGLGHLIHMPSHTYYRIGRYKESIATNIDAVAADEKFIAENDASMLYEYGYFVHNVHFVMTSAMMAGDSETALAMAEKLDAKLPAEMAVAVPFAQPIKAAPYYAMAMYADPDVILALEDPGAEVPFLQANWRYARGEAFARKGDAAGARKEAEEISRILAEEDMTPLEQNNIPVTDILKLAHLTVTARASALDGDLDTAVEAMGEAVAIQDAIAYTEPPYWYYPAKQTLAAMTLKKGDAERAEQLFIESLAYSPNNGRVLFGLSEAYRAQNDKSAAKFATGMVKDAWLGDAKALSIDAL